MGEPRSSALLAMVFPPEISVSWDAGLNWTGWEECTISNASWQWTPNTWAGLSYSKSDLDDFEVRYRGDVPTKNENQSIGCIYAVITYTASVSGYGHDFIGVASASIGKVSGVATASIGKIKGV